MMRRDRSGSYPSPPYWPERLTKNYGSGKFAPIGLNMEIEETPAAVHTYIADGYPGPCVVEFIDGRFSDWWPCLTVERAERRAQEAIVP